MLVRPAALQDVNLLVEMGVRFHQEGAYAFLPFDRDKVRRLVKDCIQDPENNCALVAEENGVVVGMMGGYLIDYFFCDEKLACDIILFVDREHRGGSAASRLVRAFREWATRQGAREICLGVSSGIKIKSTGKFYERMGLTWGGQVYRQRLPQNTGAPDLRPGGR